MKEPDFTRLREWFAAYCRPFYSGVIEDDRNIALKEEHTDRVCANMAAIVADLDLDESDRLLAKSIALLHDAGRFEQYRRFRTFRDRDSVNHAALGVQVIADAGALDFLPETDRRLILKAIGLHNVFALPADLDGRLTLFVRLIRDADKLDIWRVFVDYFAQPEAERASAAALGFSDLPSCAPAILGALLGGRMANLAEVVTLNDFKLLQLSWVYDLNFPAAFRLASEHGHLHQLALLLPQEEEVQRAVAAVTAWVCERARGVAAA